MRAAMSMLGVTLLAAGFGAQPLASEPQASAPPSAVQAQALEILRKSIGFRTVEGGGQAAQLGDSIRGDRVDRRGERADAQARVGGDRQAVEADDLKPVAHARAARHRA